MKNAEYKIIAFLIIIAFFAGCSKLQNEDSTPVSAQVNVHPEGFLKVASMDFHGKVIQNNNWNMTECKKCHGGDYSGGNVQKTCNNCHPSSPEACNVCHGNSKNPAPPKDVAGNSSTSLVSVGAHQAHLQGTDKTDGIACSDCHLIPSRISDFGHIENSASIPEIYFNSSLAAIETKGRNKAVMRAEFINNKQDVECSNTYCHGNFTNGNNYTPKWTKGASEAACGTCHSIAPKPPHIQAQACFACHTVTVDPYQNITDKSKHINGKLEVYGQVRTDW